MQRLIVSFTRFLRRWWSYILTPVQQEHMLNQADLCTDVLENLTLDFMGTRLREVQLPENQFLQNKCSDVQKLEEYYMK